MNGDDIRRLFARLSHQGGAASSAAFSALPVPGSGGHMVALSASGRLGLLLRTASDGPRPAGIRLSGMNATFGVNCTIAIGNDAPEERRMSILECTADADALPLFAESAGTFLRLLGAAPTMAEAAVAVARFASIFSSLTRLARQSVTGLIGELMVLLLSTDPARAIGCWRASPNDRFDFVGSDARVECKATSTGTRAHSFSWEQCNPPDGCTLAVSLRVESAGGGMSLGTLIERIEGRLTDSPDAAARLRETVAATMGGSLPQVLGTTFDEALCRGSLLWFDLRDVPAIRGNLPPGVTGLRFTSDLSGASPLSPMLLAETSLRSLVPTS